MRSEFVDGPIRGERLRDLAEMEGLTLTALAAQLGITQGHLSKIVNGSTPPPARVLELAALRFDLPTTFFSALPILEENAPLTYRKKASSGARSDKRITRLFKEASRFWTSTATACALPTPEVTRLRSIGDHGDVEYAADLVRETVNLSDKPIPNMVRLAERLGIGVIIGLDPNVASSPEGGFSPSESGHSDYSGATCPSARTERPLIATIAPQPGAVQRMTIAHELGHLLYDLNLVAPPRSRDLEEKRAFEFAGALLLPAPAMREHINETSSLAAYLRVKAKYGASAGAIVMRAQHLCLISAERARSLHIQIASRGWRDAEPVNVPEEKPLLITQATRRAWPDDTIDCAAASTGTKHSYIRAWMSGNSQQETNEDARIISFRHARERKRRPFSPSADA